MEIRTNPNAVTNATECTINTSYLNGYPNSVPETEDSDAGLGQPS